MLQRLSIEVTDEELDAGDSHGVLADHLRRVVRDALAGLVGEDRLTRQVELVNQILRSLEEVDSEADRYLPTPPRRLLSVWPLEPIGSAKPAGLTRPSHSAVYSPGPGLIPVSFPSSAKRSPQPIESTFFARSSSGVASESLKRISALHRSALRQVTHSDNKLSRCNRPESR